MKDAVSDVLARLMGLPLWGVGRAGIVWFQFGNRRTVPTMKGGTKEVGEFALHLGCPWRLVGRATELLACDESEPEVLAEVTSPPLVCCGVRAGEDGAFEMEFAGGSGCRSSRGTRLAWNTGGSSSPALVGPISW
jgi:hypothetical protein